MIFRFVVRRLRWLGRIPLLPHFFDAVLVVFTAVTAPKKLRALQLFEEEACRSLGATTRVHRFGGVGFYLNGGEIGHIHGNGLVDVLVGRTLRDEIVHAGEALPHHVFSASGWVSFWMKGEADVASALDLLCIASQRHELGKVIAEARRI